uniref:Transposase n=1 Tax=Bursaphelenchus xylophilus TaxID=6326 RepID=A0A1I7SIT1_BURXY
MGKCAIFSGFFGKQVAKFVVNVAGCSNKERTWIGFGKKGIKLNSMLRELRKHNSISNVSLLCEPRCRSIRPGVVLWQNGDLIASHQQLGPTQW